MGSLCLLHLKACLFSNLTEHTIQVSESVKKTVVGTAI